MKTAKKLILCLIAMCLMLSMVTAVSASRIIKDVTLNGEISVNVAANENIITTVTMKLTSGSTWEKTQYKIGTGNYVCKDTQDYNSGTHTVSFNVTSPSQKGDYDFQVWACGSSCNTRSACSTDTVKLSNPDGIHVVSKCGDGATEGAEQCDGESCCYSNCTFKPSSKVCRAAAGNCDIAEKCTGSNAICPSDNFKDWGTSCKSDKIGCTDDICDGQGTCSHIPDSTKCNNGLWCDGQETCDASFGCRAGTSVDCSANDLSEIATCSNSPEDNNDFTWDFRNAFTSECNEETDSYSCSIGDKIVISNSPAIGTCNVGCLTNEDCNALDYNYCSASNVMHDEGVCGMDYTCHAETETIENCNDGIYCNGVETCFEATCQAGTSVDCSANDRSEIATCSNDPDGNQYTWDFRSAFTSVCDESTDSCLIGNIEVISTGNDNDSDGYASNCGDCNDNVDTGFAIHPNVADICGNGIDEDCSGADSSCLCGDGDKGISEQCDDGNTFSGDGCSSECQTESSFYHDWDNDGYGNIFDSIKAVSVLDGYVADSTDCDDTNGNIHPNAAEFCNGIDDNCIEGIDEGYNIGELCFSNPNSCEDKNSGLYMCSEDGLSSECDAKTPDERENWNQTCTSEENECGETSQGFYVCSGIDVQSYSLSVVDNGIICDAITPDFLDANDNEIADCKETIGGSSGDIAGNVPGLGFLVNGIENPTTLLAGIGNVTFTSSGATIIEFNYDFSASAKLDLTKVNITLDSNAGEGSIIIQGLDLTGQDATKTAYINHLGASNTVCVVDAEVASISVVDDCTNGVKVICDGSNYGNYSCSLVENSTKYKISGLKHSAVSEYSYTAPAPSPAVVATGGSSGILIVVPHNVPKPVAEEAPAEEIPAEEPAAEQSAQPKAEQAPEQPVSVISNARSRLGQITGQVVTSVKNSPGAWGGGLGLVIAISLIASIYISTRRVNKRFFKN